MTAIRSIHHINFIYPDLEAAVEWYASALGLGPFVYEALDDRGARTARTRIGDTWLVLVAPTRDDSVPARYLAEHGPGFFLMSFGVDDLEAAMRELEARGTVFASSGPRQGVDDWRVADIEPGELPGCVLQLASRKPRA